ncbi:MAG: ribonuclease P protein component [Patescibacteria group bacterium]
MLNKKNRINKKTEIDRFFGLGFGKDGGKNFSNEFFVLKIIKRKTDKPSRFGFVVSNKVDNRATQRNLLKRRLRAIARKYLTKLQDGTEIMIIAKPAGKKADLQTLEKEFLKIMDKGKFFYEI